MKLVDDAVFKRIRQLRFDYGLSIPVISQRLGIAQRTIKVYLRAASSKTVPYHPDQPVKDECITKL